jgi:CubicO group peptidase (beta-lactamase class C family)
MVLPANDLRVLDGNPTGTFWYYNNWKFNALDTIFERLTKTTIGESFKKIIAEPLEMEDFRLEDVRS